MTHEKFSLHSLIPASRTSVPGVRTDATDIAYAPHEPITRGAPSSDMTDVCAQMFKFCKQCDEKYLQPRKIQCLFDVDSGMMHRAALQIVSDAIETLLADIAQSGICQTAGASLTVTLRKQHGVWILALTERRIASLRQTATVRRLSLVRRHAQRLGAACRVHETNEGFITALMFDCAAVASEWRAPGTAIGPSTAIH